MAKTFDESIYLARVSEQADRFEDMIEFLQVLGDKPEGEDLKTEERNLLSVAFKNAVGQRRTAWRAVSAIEQNPKYSQYGEALKKYKTKIEDEMYKLCNQIVDMIDAKLAKKAKEVESKVFFHKTKADYFRYMSEVTSGDRLAEVSGKAEEAYSAALKDSDPLDAADPIKLGLFLNFSVFHYEVKNDHKQACDLAKNAFDEAINKLDSLEEDKYKDAATILQLLRDNLTLWTAENEQDKDDDDKVIDL